MSNDDREIERLREQWRREQSRKPPKPSPELERMMRGSGGGGGSSSGGNGCLVVAIALIYLGAVILGPLLGLLYG